MVYDLSGEGVQYMCSRGDGDMDGTLVRILTDDGLA